MLSIVRLHSSAYSLSACCVVLCCVCVFVREREVVYTMSFIQPPLVQRQG